MPRSHCTCSAALSCPPLLFALPYNPCSSKCFQMLAGWWEVVAFMENSTAFPIHCFLYLKQKLLKSFKVGQTQVVHTHNPSAREVRAGRSVAGEQPLVLRELKHSLD